MKTAELTGPALDYWAARAHEMTVKDGAWWSAETLDSTPLGGSYWVAVDDWQPSTSWEQGGPIIERERIALAPWFPKDADVPPRETDNLWSAGVMSYFSQGAESENWMTGRTTLIAAMRAYVASKFGEEVPEEAQ